ncbi:MULTISPECIES: hypothetical protein [Streptomyces]|uniref:hypothetical protein n=1 Tax=Streptomyces TaxID=1883 RepID=UPI0004CD6AB6|nr:MULTISPECIES: hypothetical protein [Streptomyces]
MTPDDLADRLDQAADRIGPTVERRIRHVGTLGIASIRANASGRPGPNVITGAYRASWQSTTRRIPYGAQCTLGSDAPQARRLEFGFFDMTDSLGRHYMQPPFPHVQPALPRLGATLRTQIRHAVEEVFA